MSTGQTPADKGIFLGRSGKVFGPFTQQELDGMYAQGKLSEYTWIWDGSLKNWKPIDPPPPPLQMDSSGSLQKQEQAWDRFEVFCLNGAAILKGNLEWVTESGCLFISKQASDGPQFSINGWVDLRLLDAKRGKGLSARASVANVELKEQVWVYRLKWSSIPRIETKEDV